MGLPQSDEDALGRLLSLNTARKSDDYRRMAELSGEAAPKQPDDELTVLLAQYDSLRTECMNSTNNRVQVLILGIAAVSALAGGALTIDKPEEHKAVVFALFSIAIPLIWIFVLFTWLSEAVRAHRAGSFLAGDVESRINALLGRLVLTWEAALWTGEIPRDERLGPSAMALVVSSFVPTAAPIFGMFLMQADFHSVKSYWPLAVPYGLLALAAFYCWTLLPRLVNTHSVRSTWSNPAK